MTALRKSANRKSLGKERLYWACSSRGALEIYFQQFADARRFSNQLESGAAQRERETADPSQWSALERPFFDKGGFAGKKLHRSTVRTIIELARGNAGVFFPRGLPYDKEGKPIYGLYGKVSNSDQHGLPILEPQRPTVQRLAQIAEDQFTVLVHLAVLEGKGDFLRVIADVIEENAKSLKEILDDGRALRYQVELVQQAALELVDEAHKRDQAYRAGLSRTPESYEKIGRRRRKLRCFVPLKKKVKDRMIEICRKEKIPWAKANPQKWSAKCGLRFSGRPGLRIYRKLADSIAKRLLRAILAEKFA